VIYRSLIQIRPEKLRELAPYFQSDSVKRSNAPWLDPQVIDEFPLFPRQNNTTALEFFFLVGALNYSFWVRENDSITTWGATVNGRRVEDVFALCYCVQRARERGWITLEADVYRNLRLRQVKKIFTFGGGQTIPMLRTRLKKIRELGRGMEKFSNISKTSDTFKDFLQSYRTLPAVLDALESFFPYSFGDPLRKLSQLMLKMIIDRTPFDDEKERFETTKSWKEATRFLDGEYLRGQPDDMLPLFCLKTGLWNVDYPIKKVFRDSLELPMDHPLEQTIRQATVETVDCLAGMIEVPAGETARGHVDSVMWQTAVEGCFPVDCQGCDFFEDCGAVQHHNSRLDWDHHLTRTTYY